MKNTTLFLLSLLMGFISCKNEESHPNLLSKGISENLAIYRKNQVDSVIYRLDFKIPLKQEDSIPAHLDLSLNINNLDQPLYLDFNENSDHLLNLKVNGENIAIDHREEHLIIAPEYLKIGQNDIKTSLYSGGFLVYKLKKPLVLN